MLRSRRRFTLPAAGWSGTLVPPHQRLTTASRRREACWEVLGRRVGRSPAAPDVERQAPQFGRGAVRSRSPVDQFSGGASRSKLVALVVLLRGVNVGGHRTFRPTTLTGQLKHLDAVNIGAAGTFVIRRPIAPAQLRAELTRRLPFDTEIMICQGREIARMMSQNHFADQPVRPDIVRFVRFLSRRPRSAP